MSSRLMYDKLRHIEVIDTHEHLWDESHRIKNPGDWTGLFFQYGITALRIAGMTENEGNELYSEASSHSRKWEIFSKYFPLAKNSAYIKSVLISIKDIYGIDHISSDSMVELSDNILRSVKPGFYRKILKEKAGIDYCMVTCFDRDNRGDRYPARIWGDMELLRPDLYADMFIYPASIQLVENESGIDCSTLTGWLKAIDVYFEKNARMFSSIKIALGYNGRLNFNPDASFDMADKQYQEHIKATVFYYDDFRPLVDFLFNYILKKVYDYNLPLKFHTGLYSGTNYLKPGAIRNNVGDIVKLALANPQCDFIAMHIAYPFQDELVMSIKQVTNLYADMSWVWIVDTVSACQFLKKALCAAPVTKIMGFGGDYSLAENTYGHLEITRRAISRVLTEMIDDGYLDWDEAEFIGYYLLRGSVESLYYHKP